MTLQQTYLVQGEKYKLTGPQHWRNYKPSW